MATSINELTNIATETGILSSGRFLRMTQSVSDSDGYFLLGADPFSPPVASTVGYSVVGAGSASLIVNFQSNPGNRTIYIIMDPTAINANLTADYDFEFNGGGSDTYSGTPVDSDQLMSELAAYIGGATGISTQAVMLPGSLLSNAIKMTGTPLVINDLDFPGSTLVEVFSEIQSASLRIWARGGVEIPTNLTIFAGVTDCINGWTLVRDVGVLTTGGIRESLNCFEPAYMFIELYNEVLYSDPYGPTEPFCAALVVPTYVP